MEAMRAGNGSENRITQACDRCRKKKIKCDGIRPCCLQCKNAGLECRTSDILSRRAMSRNYTKSLEARVRSLETEVRDLKNLLEEKDEKIDMLSKMRSNRWPSYCSSSTTLARDTRDGPVTQRDDVFRVHATPLVLKSESPDSYFMGASSGTAFINALSQKIQETGNPCSAFDTEALLNLQSDPSNGLRSDFSQIPFIPPRHFSEKCMNIFCQEWAPLFPILNMVSFRRLYREYIMNPEKMADNDNLTQLHLVFAIAALSSKASDRDTIAMCEQQWQISIDTIATGNTLTTLQCLVLASLLSLLKGDYTRLQQYKGMAVGLSYRLGLHQSQKNFRFCALTLETRKRVFWSLYTVDRFSAATVGLPTLLKEEDIQCEYPTNIDDGYVTKEGYSQMVPGRVTKISSALALIELSRILSRVLEQNYPATISYALSLQSLSALDSHLSDWCGNLPEHLRFTFAQGNQATDTTSDQSAILSVAFYYVRSLIYLPTVGSTLGSKAAPFVNSLADSSKNIIQIVQVMEEQNKSFSLCLNKNKLLTLCGLSLLYQHLDLKQDDQLMRNDHRHIRTVIDLLKRANAPCVPDFRRLATSIISFDRRQNSSFSSSDGQMPTPQIPDSTPPPFNFSMPEQQMHQSPSYTMTCINEMNLREQQQDRSLLPAFLEQLYSHSNVGCNSNYSTMSESSTSCPSPTPQLPTSHTVFNSSVGPNGVDFSPPTSNNMLPYQPRFQMSTCTSCPQDGLSIHSLHSLQGARSPTILAASANMSSSVMMTDMEGLIPNIDSGDPNVYDAVYGGWSTNGWDAAALNMHALAVAGPTQGGLGFGKDTLATGDNGDLFGYRKPIGSERQSR